MTPRGIDLPEASVAGFTPGQLRYAAAAWPMRAAEELRSALVFRALKRAAVEAGVPDPWPKRFAEAAADEIRHARLCTDVGRRLDAPPPRHDVRPVRARLAEIGGDAKLRAASLLLVEVAMGETISMSLFRAGRRATTEPLSRAALTSILADEVRHQRLGWLGLASMWPRLDEADRAALAREASKGFRVFERRNAAPALARLERREPFDPQHAALGVLAPEARVEAFYAAVESLVVPRLNRLGIDGTRAWNDRYRAARARSR